MSHGVFEELYDRLISRAKKLGLWGLIEELQKTKQKGEFDYDRFIEDCERLGINPVLALSDDFKEPVIRFRLTGTLPEVEMVKVLEELSYILNSEGLVENTKIEPMTELYRSLISEGISDPKTVGMIMADKVRKAYNLPDCPNLFDFCKRNNVHLIYLTEKAPVEGFFISTGENVFIAIKKGYVPRMHWTLAHELGHFFMGHEGLDLDREDHFRSTKMEESYANFFASYLIMSPSIKFPTPECCISKQALSIRLGREEEFEPDCKSMDVSGYALNKLLKARKEELLYVLGEEGSFYRDVKKYVWDV